jgi:RimJ/RimL family protein N-acetyltransferase
MEPTEIRTDRLRLRPWQPDDAPAVLAACSDPLIASWTTVPSPYTPEHARGFVEELMPQGWAEDTEYGFAVTEAATGNLVGALGLRPRAAHGTADVGYWTALRGNGYTTEALVALCRWGHEAVGIERIEWFADVGNWASRRVAEKAGFAVEGILRKGLPHASGRRDCWIGARITGDAFTDTRRLPPAPVLTDGVVMLRPLRSTDAEDIVAGYDDEERARWLPGPSPYGIDDAHAFLAAVQHEPADGLGVPLAVTLDDDRLVGIVHLHLQQRRHGIGEVGYWVAPQVRGRGLAPHAARLLADWGLQQLGLNRVELLADVENLRSQRVAEKAGFAREGVARRARPDGTGQPRDMVLFSRIR